MRMMESEVIMTFDEMIQNALNAFDSEQYAIHQLHPNSTKENRMPLYLQTLTETAILPTRASDGAAGLDLYADEDATIQEYSRCWISTGIALAIAPAYVGLGWPRSGLAGSVLDTSAGRVYSYYRGEVKVLG